MTKLVAKLIQIDESDKKKLDKVAKEKYMKSNQLIRLIIREYLERGK